MFCFHDISARVYLSERELRDSPEEFTDDYLDSFVQATYDKPISITPIVKKARPARSPYRPTAPPHLPGRSDRDSAGEETRFRRKPLSTDELN